MERQASINAGMNSLATLHAVCRFEHDTQTGMLPGYPESAICVQRFDDSLNSAIHTNYRNWLRSSSMHEPRDPPLEVVYVFTYYYFHNSYWYNECVKNNRVGSHERPT